MASIRLEEKPFDFEGKRYILRANMAVLEDLQELHGGDINALLKQSSGTAAVEILTAMLNDYADEQGWEERWNVRDVSRRVNFGLIRDLDVIGMLIRSIAPAKANTTPAPAEAAAAEPGGDTGN